MRTLLSLYEFVCTFHQTLGKIFLKFSFIRLLIDLVFVVQKVEKLCVFQPLSEKNNIIIMTPKKLTRIGPLKGR